jgi:Tol biopolymer transport system component
MCCTRLSILAFLYLATPGVSAAGDPASERPRGTIAFASQTPRGWNVYVADVKTRKTTRLTDHPMLDFNAAAAPDGQRVAFVSERDGNNG